MHPDNQSELSRVLADYLTLVDAGRTIDRQAFIAAHPELADELRAFFAGSHAIRGALIDTDATQDAEPAVPRPDGPPEMEDYEVLEELGRGGMGIVYKARHKRLGTLVAMKVMGEAWMGDKQAVARFRREIRAIGQLHHKNVLRARDARQVDGTLILVTEFVQGTDLGKLVRRRGPLPITAACAIIRQASLGLQCIHESGLVHRDIKPSNLMLTQAPGSPGSAQGASQRVVKILDLGLARFCRDQASVRGATVTGQTVGTLDYISPEQISDSRSVDIRADIYSLGCTLYHLLTGRAPFADGHHLSALAKMRAHLRESPTSVQELRPEVPQPLADLIDRMMAKDPNARPQTPEAVAQLLEPWAKSRKEQGKHEAAALPRPDMLPDLRSQQHEWPSALPHAPSKLLRSTAVSARRKTDTGKFAKWIVSAVTALAAITVLTIIGWNLAGVKGDRVAGVSDNTSPNAAPIVSVDDDMSPISEEPLGQRPSQPVPSPPVEQPALSPEQQPGSPIAALFADRTIENRYEVIEEVPDDERFHTTMRRARQFLGGPNNRVAVVRITLEDSELESSCALSIVDASANLGRPRIQSGDYVILTDVSGRPGQVVGMELSPRITVRTLQHYSPTIPVSFRDGEVLYLGEILVKRMPDHVTGQLIVNLLPEQGLSLDGGALHVVREESQPRTDSPMPDPDKQTRDDARKSLRQLGTDYPLTDNSRFSIPLAPGTYTVRSGDSELFQGPEVSGIHISAEETTEVDLAALAPRRVTIAWRFRNDLVPQYWNRGVASFLSGGGFSTPFELLLDRHFGVSGWNGGEILLFDLNQKPIYRLPHRTLERIDAGLLTDQNVMLQGPFPASHQLAEGAVFGIRHVDDTFGAEFVFQVESISPIEEQTDPTTKQRLRRTAYLSGRLAAAMAGQREYEDEEIRVCFSPSLDGAWEAAIQEARRYSSQHGHRVTVARLWLEHPEREQHCEVRGIGAHLISPAGTRINVKKSQNGDFHLVARMESDDASRQDNHSIRVATLQHHSLEIPLGPDVEADVGTMEILVKAIPEKMKGRLLLRPFFEPGLTARDPVVHLLRKDSNYFSTFPLVSSGKTVIPLAAGLYHVRPVRTARTGGLGLHGDLHDFQIRAGKETEVELPFYRVRALELEWYLSVRGQADDWQQGVSQILTGRTSRAPQEWNAERVAIEVTPWNGTDCAVRGLNCSVFYPIPGTEFPKETMTQLHQIASSPRPLRYALQSGTHPVSQGSIFGLRFVDGGKQMECVFRVRRIRTLPPEQEGLTDQR